MNAYSFDQEALKLTQSYLCDRPQKVKKGSSFSKELRIGTLLFNIDICDLLFVDISSDIANYANTIPYECTPYYDKLK